VEPDPSNSVTLESRLSCLQDNAAIAFTRECLRLDPKQRPSAQQLLQHEYFNEFRDWFEDEIQTLLDYDQQEALAQLH
jgi:serine/threonine protein kinase